MGAPASAYDTFGGHKLTYGVSSQKYWLQSHADTYHGSSIPAAMDNWNATSTPISYSRTSTQSQSRMDFYKNFSESGQYCGLTHMYVDTSLVNPESQNWWWAKIILDPALLDADLCGPTSHRKGIIAHEAGHGMGLAHSGHSFNVMYRLISGTSVNYPQTDDINGINYLY